MVQPSTNRLLVESQRGAANGLASLGADAKVPESQLPVSALTAQALGWIICKGFTRADVIAALDAAEAKGRHTVVYFPAGVYDLGVGISLNGRSAQLRGAGGGGTKTAPTGTVFYASTQAGPVIDFTGWVIPTDVFTARVQHGGFMVRGSGVADPTKNNAGLRLKVMSSATFADIAVRDTGGPAMEFVSNPGNAVYLCDFERIILNTPVGAYENDVPYFIADEPNGNRFRSFGFRSMKTTQDTGVSGAAIITSNAVYPAYSVRIDGWWFENLHVPTNGTLLSIQGHSMDINDVQWHDIKKEPGATGTSYLRVRKSLVNDWGANIIRGQIPGTDASGDIPDTGIDMQQSRNLVEGTKGWKGANVTIAVGVTNTHIDLAGARSSSTDPAVIDNSGNLTNTWIDRYMNVERRHNRLDIDNALISSPLLRLFDSTAVNNGGVAFGKSGARIQAIGGSGSLWYTPAAGQAHVFTDGAGTEIFRGQANGTGLKLAASKSLILGTTTTAGRPSAATHGAGAVLYDTTLSKPIYSDGTVWRDAAGTAV